MSKCRSRRIPEWPWASLGILVYPLRTMAAPAAPVSFETFTAAERRRMLTRVVVVSAIGTTIEWYDFFLYGVAAALVFPKKFFPGSDPFVGQLLSFTTFFVGFVARPVGAAIFG